MRSNRLLASGFFRIFLVFAARYAPAAAPAEAAPSPKISSERLATLDVPALRQEIVAYSPALRLLLATDPHAKEISVYEVPRLDPPELIPLDFDETLPGPQGIPTGNEPTSVALHPTQPAALATVLGDHPADRGRVNFYDLRPESRGRRIHSQEVGCHPDSIAISPDGRWALIANEGEGHPGTPGTITAIDLRGWTVDQALPEGGLPAHEIRPPHERLDAKPGEIEPEYAAVEPRSRFAAVSLQENDAVLLIDLRRSPPEIAGIVRLPAGSQPDGVALLDEPAGGEEDAGLLAAAEEGVFDALGRIQGHSVSFWAVRADRLDRPEFLSRVSLRELFGKEGRPAKRLDPESVVLTRFGGRTAALVGVEQADRVAVFDVTAPRAPALIGEIPTGRQPEGLIVTPRREDLIVITGDEGGPGEITFGRLRLAP